MKENPDRTTSSIFLSGTGSEAGGARREVNMIKMLTVPEQKKNPSVSYLEKLTVEYLFFMVS
jgi:hypothetical protein